MKIRHIPLLVASVVVVFLVLGGGLFVKVGAAESSYRQAVLFAEVLSLVLENYVDPVEADRLLKGAYEGMLSGLDAHGAYLSPDEVRAWKAKRPEVEAGPGISVLKSGRMFQVVAVDAESSASAAGVTIGDQVRELDGQPVKDLSLDQFRRLLLGEPGTSVRVSIMRSDEGLKRQELDLVRAVRHGRSYTIDVDGDVAVVRVLDLDRLSIDALTQELDDVTSRGVSHLLLDLRNLAEGTPQHAAALAAVFAPDPRLELRDRSGRLVESIGAEREEPAWAGSVTVLVNGATAGAGEAVAALLRNGAAAEVLGETTYGLGAEPKLYELENGSGLLVSSALWGVVGGDGWNEDGVEPDEEVQGEGDDYASVSASQLQLAIARVRERATRAQHDKAA